MSLKRYNFEADFGVPYMDEDTTGDWVRLEDVVKLLETWCCRTDDCGFDKVLRNTTECEQAQDAIALIKGKCAKGSVESAQLEVLIKGEK